MIAEAHWDQSSPRLLQGKRSVPGGRTVFFADSEPFVGASPGVDGGFPLADRIPKPRVKVQKTRGVNLRGAGVGTACY
jgi:hypothetical protein